MNYYNENDPKACAWLRELIAAGLVPAGHVDERSILDVRPADLVGFSQVHCFAGIGGWPYALRLAGWPDDEPVWTASCPCQPFSAAGKGKGGGDDRHVWPVFHRLVTEFRPQRIFGEQVAQAIGFNWLDRVSADLEADGYAVGAVVLGAHSLGAPHIRQRLYWVADSDGDGRDQGRGGEPPTGNDGIVGDGGVGRLVHAIGPRLEGHAGNGDDRDQPGREREKQDRSAPATGSAGGLGDAECGGRVGDARRGPSHESADASPWAAFDLLPCLDGKTRRVESGTFPLAHGVPGRVGLLRGYGNAIVPQVAAEFILAFQESQEI